MENHGVEEELSIHDLLSAALPAQIGDPKILDGPGPYCNIVNY